MKLDEIGMTILRSAYHDPYDWRTLGAISRETGLSLQAVEGYIHDHPELFRAPPISPRGSEAYGLQPDVADHIEEYLESVV